MIRLLFILLIFSAHTAIAGLRVEMAQITVRPGDFNSLMGQIVAKYELAIKNGADLFVLPEGVLPGYPSNDVLNEKGYIDRAEQAVEQLRELTRGKKTAMVVGHIGRNPKKTGRALQNFLSVFDNGELTHRQAKVLLPTYGPFDDARYFEPGTIDQIKVLEFRGKRLSFLICEDAWYYVRDKSGRLLYKHNPVLKTKKNSPDLVISISASPFNRGKQALRESVHLDVSKRVGAPILYVNQVGIVDGLGFDGGSFVASPDGKILYKMESFKTDSMTVDIPDITQKQISEVGSKNHEPKEINENELVIKAVVNGIREYTKQIGGDSVVFGLSGGMDSAMAAFFSTAALGAENVFVVKMPSQHSTSGSITDADAVIESLKIPAENVLTISIQDIIQGFGDALARAGIDLKGLSQSDATVPYENVQARSRMVLEFFISNLNANPDSPFVKKMAKADPKWKRFFMAKKIKIQTSNKSELASGNGAIFADMAGSLAPNADLFKTELWEIANYLNSKYQREVIPNSIILKEPSAELMTGQVSVERFPSYKIIDPILEDLVSGHLNPEELEAKHQHLESKVAVQFRPLVQFVSRLFYGSEFKRQISQAPIIRVSEHAFGKEFRKPITAMRMEQVPTVVPQCRALFN